MRGGDRDGGPAPGCTWRLRARRDHNPLLRGPTPVERVTVLGIAVLALSLLAAVLFAVVAVGDVARVAAAQQSTQRHQVTATATGSPQRGVLLTGVPVARTESEHVNWYWHGQRHDGRVRLSALSEHGSTATVWVDDAGKLTAPPTSGADVVVARVIVGIGAVIIGIVVLVVALAWRRRWLLCRRMRCWEREWETVGPQWTGRSGRF